MIPRRRFVLGAALAGLAACSRKDERARPQVAPAPPPTPPPAAPPFPDAANDARGRVKTETWTLDGDGRAYVIVPSWTPAEARLPMLLAFHGRGEAVKGPSLGVLGWPNDYALLRAIERVCAPPLTTMDFETFVEPSRLEAHNAALSARPFGGLVVVCPYSPDVDLRKPPRIAEYADYVMQKVLPRARRELPVDDAPGAVGIDGVSLGGALALRIGLGHPESFGAVGTLQAAIGEDQVPELTELAKTAKAKNPALHLRLLTSKDDYFRKALSRASLAWRAAGVDHEFVEVPGPHDYPFNRGPGALEMLLWHDRVLRSL